MNTRPKILIVDDRPENLIAIEVVLRDLEVDLVKAYNGNEALKQTLYHDFALALLDIQMPDMDGYELAEIMRAEEKTANLPFIFISAVYTDNLNVFKGYERGAFSFITKPFQPEILINKVKFFIEKHQQELAVHKLNASLESKNLELLEVNKELEAFSYSVSHDLRAPLRAINGYSRMLLEDYENQLDAEGQRIIRTVAANATKMGKLIDELLAFSRMGRKEMQKKSLDMNELVRSTLTEVEKVLPHSAQINVNQLPSVHADDTLLRQVLFNLISNAVKYSSRNEKSVVEISWERKNDEEVFTIKDNGAGFDMRYADKLFGVFQRLHTDEEFEGIGVGLALVKRIINRHGGKVWAEGKVNEGAAFYFTIPAAELNL